MASKLSEADKQAIAFQFSSQNCNIKQLALTYNVSTRTIGRVLDEAGVTRPHALIAAKNNKITKLLADYGITSGAQLEVVLQEHKEGPAISTLYVAMANLDEATYNKLLADIIHLREAKKHNISVQGAMLKVERKAEANADDIKAS